MKKIRIFDSYQELKTDGVDLNNSSIEEKDTLGKHDKRLSARIFFMGNLSEEQKINIKAKLNEFKKPALGFNEYGLLPSSYPLVEKIRSVLNENPDIRLEIAVRKFKDELTGGTVEITELWAQELAFYFRYKKTGVELFNCTGIGITRSIFGPIETEVESSDGEVEIIFIKNK